MKLVTYFTLSFLAMSMYVLYAIHMKQQFYPTILYLVNSKVSFILTLNLSIGMTLVIGSVFNSIFLGKLRDVEVELLVDKLKYYIMDISLALTIFRNELNLGVLGQFLLLLFLKSFHWLAKARLDYLEQIHPVPILMHIRQTSLLIFLFICDLGLGYYCLDYTITKGKSVLILFGFELILLFLSVVNIFIRYILQITDNSLPNGLHSKGLYIMILDLIHDALAFVIYVCFFGLVFHYYGLPLHIVRETWIAFSVFQRRLTSFIKYLRLVHNIEKRFPDATPEELTSSGDCLVCREGFAYDCKAKKLPCSHVFHLECLRMWLQHQQTCPLCRAEIPIAHVNNDVLLPQQPDIVPPEPVPDEDIPEIIDQEETRLTLEQLLADIVASKTTPQEPLQSPNKSTQTKDTQQFPAFFLVVQDVPLCSVPQLGYTHINRTIKKGTLLFASKRVSDDSNSFHWLEVPDGLSLGYVTEESVDTQIKFLIPYVAKPSKVPHKRVPFYIRKMETMLPQVVTISPRKPQMNVNHSTLTPTSAQELAMKLDQISKTLMAMQKVLGQPSTLNDLVPLDDRDDKTLVHIKAENDAEDEQ